MVTCVRCYLRFRLSYRDVASIAAELGVAVAPTTILRCVVRYAEEFARWHEQIGDPTLADGILDRLVHNAHRIEMRGESMRKNRGKVNG
jgi:hypothetical protein